MNLYHPEETIRLLYCYGKQDARVIKRALRKHVPKKLVRRKSAWDLSIFEWMTEGGVLHPFVKDLNKSQFAKSAPDLIKVPNIWVWDLITFHIWLKQFNLTEGH